MCPLLASDRRAPLRLGDPASPWYWRTRYNTITSSSSQARQMLQPFGHRASSSRPLHGPLPAPGCSRSGHPVRSPRKRWSIRSGSSTPMQKGIYEAWTSTSGAPTNSSSLHKQGDEGRPQSGSPPSSLPPLLPPDFRSSETSLPREFSTSSQQNPLCIPRTLPSRWPTPIGKPHKCSLQAIPTSVVAREPLCGGVCSRQPVWSLFAHGISLVSRLLITYPNIQGGEGAATRPGTAH